ncbi:MAG: hypothetical protein ACRC2S_00520 [Waterburya sp.]
MITQSTIIKSTSQNPTCSQCTHFQDFSEANGRGWCHLFEVAARQHHHRTNDCDLYAQSNPIDAPHSRFSIESIVKIIDPDEPHTEWATFIVVGRKYNTELYRSTKSYLNEPDWYYKLANMEHEETFEPIWVAENEICEFDSSHNICTEDIDIF